MQAIRHELKQALRSIVGQPLFSMLVVGVLAVGLTAVIYALVAIDHMVIRPLPFPAAGQLLSVGLDDGNDRGGELDPLRTDDVLALRRQLAGVAEVSAFTSATVNLSDLDRPERYNGAFVSANFAFDHYLSDVNSGIGLLVHHDKAGSGALRTTSITGQYAYEIELKRKVFLRPALQFGWSNHAVNLSQLTFGDQLARGGSLATLDDIDGTSVSYADMGTGLLFFTPKLWLGVAIHHLNRPNQTLIEGEARLPRKFSMHGGYRTEIRTPVIRKHAEHVVFAFNYRSQDKFDQLDLGVYYERDPFFAGLWYRGIPLFKQYGPGYIRMAAYSGGAHEITLGYELAQKHKKRSANKRRIVPCAKF